VRSFATCSFEVAKQTPTAFFQLRTIWVVTAARRRRSVLLRNSRTTPRPAEITDEKPTYHYQSAAASPEKWERRSVRSSRPAKWQILTHASVWRML
jgi:hypothetical protein